MIQDPTIFTNDGPMMTGTWYNPTNGDSFTVADSFFQDNQYIVKTTDGRLLDYNFIQHYVKSDKPIPKQTVEQKKEKLPEEVTNLLANNNDDDILEEDLQLISNNNLGNLKDNQRNNPSQKTHTQSTSNISTELVIVQKALSKTSEPLMNIDITWNNFPSKEIGLLTEVMDINVDDIISYYLSQIDMQGIYNNLATCLIEFIKNKLGGSTKLESEENDEKEVKSDKKTKNTNKKKNTKK